MKVNMLKVAEYLGTNHTEFILSENEAINELENILNTWTNHLQIQCANNDGK